MDDISSQDLQSVRGYDHLETHASLRPRHLALLHAYILASTKRRLYYRGHKTPPPENARRQIRDSREIEPARTRGANPRNGPCLTISRRSVGLGQGMGPSTSTSARESPELYAQAYTHTAKEVGTPLRPLPKPSHGHPFKQFNRSIH